MKSFGATTDAGVDRVAGLTGVDKSSLIRQDSPYTGTAVTKNVLDNMVGAPELNTAGNYMKVEDGAAMYQVSRYGGPEKIAAVRIDGKWLMVK